MASWQWIADLREGKSGFDWRFVVRFSLKVVAALIVINLLWIALNPMDLIERFSLYGTLVPPRTRASDPLSLDEIFAASPISQPAVYSSQYRTISSGDSSIWGNGLSWDHTLPECLNELGLKTPDGRLITAFNLAYPSPSMLLDLITMRRALNYHVDHVVWILSGVGLDRYTMFSHALLQANLNDVWSLLDQYPIAFPTNAAPLPRFTDLSNLFNRTFIGQRNEILVWMEAQLNAFVWLQTRTDAMNDFPPRAPRTFVDRPDMGLNYNPGLDLNRGPNDINVDDFMFDSIVAGQAIADKAGVKLTMILEPMWVAPPGTTQQRYNEYYPKWYFDLLHSGLQKAADASKWDYLDWTTVLDNDLFTDSPFHYTPKAACQLANRVGNVLRDRSTK